MAYSQRELFSQTFDDFEHTYQNSYSHGLEKIYALENVDIRSIRKLETSPFLSTKASSKKLGKTLKKPLEKQPELPLGFPFQREIELFLYREPIQVLQFSKKVENWLINIGKLTLGDLLDKERQSIINLSGMGQGHLDEVVNRLQAYLEEHFIDRNEHQLDFNSWLKNFVGDLEPKKCAVLLAAFDIPSLLPLSPSENAEIRKLTTDNRDLWTQEALEKCRTKAKTSRAHADVHQIVEVYVKPWMYSRGGIASFDELEECLLKLSGNHPYLQQVLHFFTSIYFNGYFPFEEYLYKVEDHLYCQSFEVAKSFQTLLGTSLSYFYKDDLHYSLESLKGLICREFAIEWVEMPELFIERGLRLSSCFRVRKDFSQKLIIKLS